MMRKVKLPVDVARALNYTLNKRGKGWTRNMPELSNAAKRNPQYAAIVGFIKEKEGNYELLQDATVLGFDYDATPEERLRDYYNSLKDVDYHLGDLSDVVVEVLSILEKEIEGINC
ncbi:hypothetical protein P4655_03250 [Priestia megaterium]|uniref:hypothetical protein n=1 Tax=Priestia megaterium TaxID=1404 RepID=UPI0030C97CE7